MRETQREQALQVLYWQQRQLSTVLAVASTFDDLLRLSRLLQMVNEEYMHIQAQKGYSTPVPRVAGVLWMHSAIYWSITVGYGSEQDPTGRPSRKVEMRVNRRDGGRVIIMSILDENVMKMDNNVWYNTCYLISCY